MVDNSTTTSQNGNDISLKARQLIDQMRSKGSLPALSENVQDISRLTKLSKTCAADLASVIMRDCGLTSNILVTANSTYYSPKYPIKTVSSAVTFLGFEKVYSLAFGLSIFKQNIKDNYTQELLKLYASSYFTGTLSMSLAREYKYQNPEELFVAGLLYQLPSLALAHAFPEKFQQVEMMMAKDKKSMNQACLKVFSVEYDEICRAVAEIYRMPGKVEEVLKQKERGDSILGLVHESSNIANMLFGGKPGGKTEISKVEKRIKDILKRPKFSVPDLIKRTCDDDNNVERFFNLGEDDVEMMVNILEWGKANPAQVISKLDMGDALAEENRPLEEPELLFGRFMTELSMARRKEGDINQTLMLAQEALYRCLDGADVFTAFFDGKHKMLKGRFYAGNNLLINATDFFIDTEMTQSPILDCFTNKQTISWNANDGHLKLTETLIKRLRLRNALFSPLFVEGKPIGLYFIARPSAVPFSERDEIWLEQVIENVEMTFNKMRHKR